MYDSSARPYGYDLPKPPGPSAAPASSGRGPAPHIPNPPPITGAALTVDDAWALFGIPQKRATKEDVKRRYLAFVVKWHPDVNPDPSASDQLARANAAWTLLQKHCRWDAQP